MESAHVLAPKRVAPAQPQRHEGLGTRAAGRVPSELNHDSSRRGDAPSRQLGYGHEDR